MPTFLRAIWGDETIPRVAKVWEDVEKAQRHTLPVEAEVIAFGEGNAR